MCLVGSYFCCSWKASTLCNTLGVMWRLSRKCTLHIGATKIAPFQSCGSLRWISKATAPPIESPYKNLALFMYSSLSAIQHNPPISVKNRRSIFLTHVYCCWLSTTIWQIGTSTYIPSSHLNLYIKHDIFTATNVNINISWVRPRGSFLSNCQQYHRFSLPCEESFIIVKTPFTTVICNNSCKCMPNNVTDQVTKSFSMSSPVIFFWRKIAKWRHSFLKTEHSVANSLFLRKQFAKKRQKTGFLGMVSPHVCLLATIFKVSSNRFAS